MVLGQALDLTIGQTGFGKEDVATMQALKTGALFRFACEAGAILGRASASERAALIAYAAAFGQAFQLADDLLDAEGDATHARQGRCQGRRPRQGDAHRSAWDRCGQGAARRAVCQRPKQALAPFGEGSNAHRRSPLRRRAARLRPARGSHVASREFDSRWRWQRGQQAKGQAGAAEASLGARHRTARPGADPFPHRALRRRGRRRCWRRSRI